MTDAKLKNFADIHLKDLVSDWVDQPLYVRHFAEESASKKLELNQLKDQLSITESEVEVEIRNNPESFGLTKVTETAIKTMVSMNSKVRKAKERVNQCKYEADMLDAALLALEHKKRALESLVSLHGQSYFAAPVDKTGVDVEEQKQKKIVEKTKLKK